MIRFLTEVEKKLDSKLAQVELRVNDKLINNQVKDRKLEKDSESLQKQIEQQITALEANLRNQFVRRIEVNESSIDGILGRLDKAMSAINLDAERSEAVETTLGENVKSLAHCSEKIGKLEELIEAFESKTERDLKKLRGE